MLIELGDSSFTEAAILGCATTARIKLMTSIVTLFGGPFKDGN